MIQKTNNNYNIRKNKWKTHLFFHYYINLFFKIRRQIKICVLKKMNLKEIDKYLFKNQLSVLWQFKKNKHISGDILKIAQKSHYLFY